MPPEGFGISARNITVSTVGVVPGIRKLAEEGIPVRLAVSLHAPSDELRDELVPMNKRFNTKQVLDAGFQTASQHRIRLDARHQRPGGTCQIAGEASEPLWR